MGALNNSERGVWSTTELGRTMTPEDVAARHSAYKTQLREARRAKRLARAKQEATRDGTPPVDLIDGERLCDLLKEHKLGVRTIVRQVEDVEVSPEFFSDL